METCEQSRLVSELGASVRVIIPRSPKPLHASLGALHLNSDEAGVSPCVTISFRGLSCCLYIRCSIVVFFVKLMLLFCTAISIILYVYVDCFAECQYLEVYCRTNLQLSVI